MELTIRLAERHAACPDLLKEFLGRLDCDPAKVKAGIKTNVDRNTVCYFEGLEVYPSEEDLAGSEWILDVEQSGFFKFLLLNGRPWVATSHAPRKTQVGRDGSSANMPSLEELLEQVPAGVRHLGLFSWDSVEDLSALSSRSELRSLSLAHCSRILGIFPLASLEQLESLDLSGLRRLEKVDYVLGRTPGIRNGCALLRRLVLNDCGELQGIDPLRGCEQLEHLDLFGCREIRSIEALRGLSALKGLDLWQCVAVEDLSVLASLSSLQTLRVNSQSIYENLTFLSGLSELRELNLSSSALFPAKHPPNSGLNELRNLRKLQVLELECWSNLADISALADLQALEVVDFERCAAVDNLSPLVALPELYCVGLSGCSNLRNLDALTRIPKLRSLSRFRLEGHADLSGCYRLESLEPLAQFPWITDLSLKHCQALTDLSSLAQLTELGGLSLEGCTGVASLSHLSGLSKLAKLNIKGAKRVRSLAALRTLNSLVELECDFHPALVAELLAHAAWRRRDLETIRKEGGSWGKEALACERTADSELQGLVTALCSAFTLIDDRNETTPLEKLLYRHPEFTSAPWKAWFGGTLKESGFDLYRRRVERVSLAEMTSGAIGGACLTLPLQEQLDWSRQWLAELEKSRLGDAKTLLPVAPEICLAYARSGDRQALRRWLEAFTDPSDPAALDPVHAALARFQIGGGDLAAAENHVHAIHSPAARDPLLGELVIHLAASDEDLASASLLLIEDQALRIDLAKKLVAKASASEVLIHRCIVAAGESPQAVADLISALPQSARSELVVQLSKKLQTDRKTMLLGLADELESQARLLRAKAASEPASA